MIIEIGVDAASDPDAHQWLDRLVGRIEDCWHVWQIDAPEELGQTAWLRDDGRAGARAGDLIRAAVHRSAYPFDPHTRQVRVTINPVDVDDATPEEAFRLADERLVVLVENRQSDGAFLRRVVAELDRTLNKYWSLTPSPIRIDDRGGKGQMPDEVLRCCENANSRPRMVVVVDSDRLGPNEQASGEARRLEAMCAEYQVPCWVLAKREAENYLPQPLLDARPNAGSDHALRALVWANLNDDQKDYYDMKDGLPGGNDGPQAQLFEGLSRDDTRALSNGFGENIDACWKEWAVQVRDALRQRGRGDLEHGVKLLRHEV